jgi:hypothetical protein
MPSLRITNLREFEARLSGGVKNLSRKTFNEVKKEARTFLSGLATNVENTPDYNKLRNDSELRGKLGLAVPGKKTGGDTDAEDLIELLRRFQVRTKNTGRSRQFRITFPSIDELEKKLTHSLSRLDKGRVIHGPRSSWFRWWEFGDRGEIRSLTVLRKTVNKLVSRSGGKDVSRASLLDIIRQRSRSNEALQIPNRRADENSSIRPTGLIRKVYSNFARVFPARMGKVLRRIVTANGGRAEKFFARGVIR